MEIAWEIFKKSFKKFDYTFPQNLESKRYLKKLEVKKIRFLGNLKFSQKKF